MTPSPSLWSLEIRDFRPVCFPLFLGQALPEVFPDAFPDPLTPIGKLLWKEEGEGKDRGDCAIDYGHAAGSISHGSSKAWGDGASLRDC